MTQDEPTVVFEIRVRGRTYTFAVVEALFKTSPETAYKLVGQKARLIAEVAMS